MAEAIEFLRMRSRELDAREDPNKKGIGFVTQTPPAAPLAAGIPEDQKPQTIAKLQLRNVTLGHAIREVCKQTQLDAYITPGRIAIVPRGQAPTTEDGKAIPDLIPIYKHPKSNKPITDKSAQVGFEALNHTLLKDIDIREKPLDEALATLNLAKDPKGQARHYINTVIRRKPETKNLPKVTLRTPYTTFTMAVDELCRQSHCHWTIETNGDIPVLVLMPAE
ncbi:hypothetical protein Rhal01_02155 [Rubritalea halochordaticola]|uniref:Uncharacterized protein n=1 Tax=Rubritalea halochordaticola TaxID=714537 RepID=A0ABP9UZV9_9BACT